MWLTRIIILSIALWLGACSTTDIARPTVALSRADKVALLPILNHTDTPQAGLRAEAIAESLLISNGVTRLVRYPSALNQDTLLEPAEHKILDEGLKWAKTTDARFALTGAVEEWRYKVGIDGEPAVGVSLKLIDLKTGDTVWSAVGGKAGWSREALSAVAQKLMRELLSGARFN